MKPDHWANWGRLGQEVANWAGLVGAAGDRGHLLRGKPYKPHVGGALTCEAVSYGSRPSRDCGVYGGVPWVGAGSRVGSGVGEVVQDDFHGLVDGLDLAIRRDRAYRRGCGGRTKTDGPTTNESQPPD
jgi:hypothetical protein